MTTKKKTRAKKTGPGALVGTRDARRLASAVLEVLAGVCGPQDAAAAMGVAMPRYYQLETRALQAVIDAMEPRPRGKKPNLEQTIKTLEAEKAALAKEALRYQALHRAAQRAMGLNSAAHSNGKTAGRQSKVEKKVRRRRQRSRGERVAEALRADAGVVVEDDDQVADVTAGDAG